MTDEQIVSLYWLRDEAAIEETDTKYGSYLEKVAQNILGNREDSLESVNDTYLHAWNAMPPHKPGVLSTFLAKITRRVSIDRFRKKHRQKRGGSEYALSLEELGQCVSPDATPEETLDTRLLAESLGRFLASQPETARNVFVARYFFLDSLREAAACCGLTESAIKSQLHRTRLALRAHLEQEGFL